MLRIATQLFCAETKKSQQNISPVFYMLLVSMGADLEQTRLKNLPKKLLIKNFESFHFILLL